MKNFVVIFGIFLVILSHVESQEGDMEELEAQNRLENEEIIELDVEDTTDDFQGEENISGGNIEEEESPDDEDESSGTDELPKSASEVDNQGEGEFLNPELSNNTFQVYSSTMSARKSMK